MIYASRLSLSLLLLRVKATLILACPVLAYGADNAVQRAAEHGSLAAVSALTWLALAGFSLLGWCVSELDKVAELWNTDGRSQYEIWRERLKLLKGVAASLAAGMLVYFLGQGAPGFLLRSIGVPESSGISAQVPEMVLFVFVSGAGYMGVRWFAWVEAKFFQGA